MRLIHAVRELNEAGARADPPDRALHRARAPRDVRPRRRRGVSSGRRASSTPATAAQEPLPRLRGARARARAPRAADAAWVGWGFVAEHPRFAELCERLGIVFVGPDAAVMRRARRQDRGQAAGRGGRRPVAPWSGGPVETVEEALAARGADRLPADGQGGGRRRRARHPPRRRGPDELASRLRARPRRGPGRRSATPPCCSSSSSTPARHVEVQVIADGQGAAGRVGVRDCSCQRRNQKVIEESASPALDAPSRSASCEQAARAAGAARRLPQRRHRRVPLRARGAVASRSWRSTPACRSSTR